MPSNYDIFVVILGFKASVQFFHKERHRAEGDVGSFKFS